MPLRNRHRTNGIRALTLSLRWLSARHALPLLFIVAALMVAVSQTRQDDIAAVRARVTQGMIPLWQAMAAPANFVASVSADLSDWRHAYDENRQLRADNAALLQWRAEAQRLAAENAHLRKLDRYVTPAGAHAVTARVVTDPGGAYQRSLLVLAGFEDGIEAGQVALGAEGVIGRVIEVGPKAARILLLTDVNARLPVRLEQSGATAIVAGDGDATPHLLYLPHDANPANGERVVTSGHGGIFPAGLPVGTLNVPSSGKTEITLNPLEDASAAEIVRIVDYHAPTDTAPAAEDAAPVGGSPALHIAKPAKKK